MYRHHIGGLGGLPYGILVVVLGIVLLWRSYEYRIIKIKKDHDLQISNLDVHAYRAQMNPHFIFNAFNGKQAAMLLRGENEFNKYITSFSKIDMQQLWDE